MMPKWEARNGKKNVFALYLFKFKSFSGSQHFVENGTPKGVIDAERNRRTLEKLANQIPCFGGSQLQTNVQVPNTA